MWWWHYNTSKRSVVADLTTDADVDAVRRLVAGADVFLEGAGPEALGALGLDWSSLAAADTRLVMVTITPFGSASPARR